MYQNLIEILSISTIFLMVLSLALYAYHQGMAVKHSIDTITASIAVLTIIVAFVFPYGNPAKVIAWGGAGIMWMYVLYNYIKKLK